MKKLMMILAALSILGILATACAPAEGGESGTTTTGSESKSDETK
jgi:hypothetical protein